MIVRLVRKKDVAEPVEVPSEVVESLDYKGFRIEIHELTQEGRYRFMPLIKKGKKVALRIFVRSKNPYVSREHLAKRAIDHREKMGEWPKKFGTPIS